MQAGLGKEYGVTQLGKSRDLSGLRPPLTDIPRLLKLNRIEFGIHQG